jgi:hypothetical protein
MAIYNRRTVDLTPGGAAKVWKMLFHYKNVIKMNELKGAFVKSTLTNVETNPDEWFAEPFFIRRRLEEDYKCSKPLVMLR